MMKTRKLIALLSAVLMLCAMIPMGAINVSAAIKLDNNFDDGTVGKFKADETIVNENSALKWTTAGWKNLYASFSVFANRDYKVTFKMKAAAATAMEVKYLSGSWGDSGIEKDTINVGTEWTEYSRILNAGSNNALFLLFQSHKATDVYIDDVKVAEYVVPVDPTFPADAIYAEDFESGSLDNWNYNCSIVSSDNVPLANAEGGNYAMQFVSPNYSYTNYKLAVEKNKDYKVVFSILSETSGYPINARVRANSTDLGYVQYTPVTTDWETHSYTFNSGNNTTVDLRFQANWETGTYYIDNIYVVPFERTSLMSNDGHVMNGNWETGDATEWANSPNTEVVTDPTGADRGYVIKTFETSTSAVDMFVQEFKNLVVGKEYKLSFKVYSYSTANNAAFWVRFPKEFTTWNVNVGSTGLTSQSANNYTPRVNINNINNAWHDVNITFTAQATTAKVQFMNYRSGQGFYYFDDISVTATDLSALNDGYITNGDFEIGSAGDWKFSADTTVSAWAAYNSAFGVKLSVNSASWGGMLNQTITGLTPGAKYNVTFWYKVIQQGVNWKIEGETQKSADKKVALTSGYVNTKSWTKVSKEFIADATTARINFSGSGITEDKNTYENGIDEMYVDSIVITEVKDAPVYCEGKAVSEDVNGLAFKFNMNDIVIDTEEDGYTAIYNDSNKVSGYKLVAMGAVMSNQSADATASRTNAGAAGVAGTVDIHAAKLWEDGEDTASFVVRILNIPLDRDHGGTTIYARPYYVVEINGVEVTIYGAVQSASYNEVLGNSAE